MVDSKSFDRDLFYRLCEKYGLELSDKYDKPMIKESDGTVRPLTDKDVLNILKVGRWDLKEILSSQIRVISVRKKSKLENIRKEMIILPMISAY